MNTKFFTFLLFILIISQLNADIIREFEYSPSKLKIHQKNDFQQVLYQDMELTQTVGLPQMPFEMVQLRISVDTVLIESIEYENIDGEFNIYPAQKPQILSIKTITPTLAKNTAQTRFPESPVEILDRNDKFTTIKIYPVQYLADSRQIRLISKLQLRIATKNDLTQLSPTEDKIISKLTKTPQKQSSISTTLETVNYIIITSEEFSQYFAPLQQWKYKKGLSAKIITTEYITSNYTGIDLQEKIRNCIKDYHENHSTEWVLLGGDTDVVPDRKAWAFDCEANYADHENEIPCDLYYSDLDGSWNADGDQIFGEIEDNIDIIPDVFVGRAPVENVTDVQVFVDKVLSYEHAMSDDYQTNMMFLAQLLWTDPYTDSGDSKNFIDENFVPGQFDPIVKYYQSTATANRSRTLDGLNFGTHIINHDGHAWYSVMSLGASDGSLGYDQVLSLTNKDRYSIIYSIGCWPAAIDYHAIAEDFITNPNGGAVAFIGNSRYGWGSPGNPLFGYSDRFDQQFFKQLFVNDITNIGATLAAAKTYYSALSKTENVYRWCQYEINLLGDPEMMVFTDLPEVMAADFPASLPIGDQKFSVYVHNGEAAIANATICLSNDNGTYLVAKSGDDGIANFAGNIDDSSDELAITITAQNFKPFESTIDIENEKPFIALLSFEHDELFEQLPKMNQLIHISPEIRNSGMMNVNSINITLTTSNEKIIIADSTVHLEQLNSQESQTLTNLFSFEINEAFEDQEIFNFELKITDADAKEWNHAFSIIAQLPKIEIIESRMTQSNLKSGDNFQIISTIKNTGSIDCENFTVAVSTSNLFQITDFTKSFEALEPGETATQVMEVKVSNDVSVPNYAGIDLEFTTSSNYLMEANLYFPLGNFGYFDDFENSSTSWEFITPETNQWHRSTLRKYSGNYSLYCGVESTQKYDLANQENVLESNEFYPGKDGKLSFYAWYEFPNYGTSGMTVEFIDQNSEKAYPLDFIGSGGALGILPTGNDWMKYEYDLSFLDDNAPGKIRLKVNIDEGQTPTEGIYIDDVKVEDKNIMFTNIDEIEIIPDKFQLFQNYPNPFNPTTTINYQLSMNSEVRLEIYNILGEKVSTLVSEKQPAGKYQVFFDGNGFASGVYFYQLEANGFIDVKKCLLIK